MIDVSNGTTIYVPKDIARQATTVIDDSAATYIADGEVVLADLAGAVVTTNAITYTGKDRMCIYFRKGEKIYKSAPLSAKNLKHYGVEAFSPTVNKVVYLGYNGVDGDLEGGAYTAATDYLVTVRDKELLGHMYDDFRKTKVGNWYSGTNTADQSLFAAGLAHSLVMNFRDSVHQTSAVEISMVSAAASTAAGSTVALTTNNAVAVATGAHGYTACDFLRCNASKTTAVYKIKEVQGNLIILETPFQGDSVTLTPQKLTTPTIEDFGIKFVGKRAKFVAGKFNFDLSNFTVAVDNFDNTLLRTAVEADAGNGNPEQVMEIEWELEQYEGVVSRQDHLAADRALYTDLTKSYDLVSLSTADTMHGDAIAGRPESLYTVMIAIPVGSTQGDSTTASRSSGIVRSLDDWLTANTPSTYTEVSKL